MDENKLIDKAAREFRWGSVLASCTLIVLGSIMLLRPAMALRDICLLTGGAVTAYGVFNILSFFLYRGGDLTFEVVVGILATAIGLLTIAFPTWIFEFIQVCLGLAVITDSLLGIKQAFTLRELSCKDWWFYLLLSAATAVLGVLFITRQGMFGEALFIVIGAVFLYRGISRLLSILRIAFLGRRLRKRLGTASSTSTEIVVDPHHSK